ncbi:MAG: hypothetical protein K2L86_14020 [Lachnospiraceae bacterium]|nr:hypothetical protein [Lachnospiraceae bacterium]
MHTKTMEGLVGARTNMNLLNTPMRVFKEARRKGDTAAMERAMGYVGDFSDKVEQYQAEADKGMEEDAKEAREKAKQQREEAIRKRKEEREKLEEKLEESRNADANTDTDETDARLVENSEEGRVYVKDDSNPDGKKSDAVKEPMAYTKAGAALAMEQEANISVSV